MKRKNSEQIALAIAVLSGIALVGCGKSSNAPPVVPGGIPGAQYGAGACVPLTGQLAFTANGAYVDSANLYAGQVPSARGEIHPGNYGTTILGGGAAGQWQGSHVDGSISLNITSAGQAGLPPGYNPAYNPGYNQGYQPGYAPPGYAPGYNPSAGGSTTGQATVSGVINISPATMQDIAFTAGVGTGYQPGYQPGYSGQPGYPGQPGYIPQPGIPNYGAQQSQICISGIAMDLGLAANVPGAPYPYYTYGNVYLYLNSTTHGYTLYL